MFTQMRATLTTQRMLAKARRYRGENDAPTLINHRDVLEFVTLRAAESVGLSDKIGTLTPGKYADLIAIRAEDINNMPVNNAVGTIVLATESKNIDMVFVAGALRKWQGALVGQDIDKLRRMVKESRDAVSARVGFEIHPTKEIKVHHKEGQATVDDLIATAV
jgi:cytosine/adenosine deaminase-related metal-dependent hydrolase